MFDCPEVTQDVRIGSLTNPPLLLLFVLFGVNVLW